MSAQILNASRKGGAPSPHSAPPPEKRPAEKRERTAAEAYHLGLWQGALGGAVVTLLIAGAAILFAQSQNERALAAAFDAATEANTAGFAVGVVAGHGGRPDLAQPPTDETRDEEPR